MTLFLIIVIAGGGWIISLFIWPFGPCGKCGGSGLNKGSSNKRFGLCRRCRGQRRHQRFGSKTVHRAVWIILGERVRAREARKEREASDRAEHPRHHLDN